MQAIAVSVLALVAVAAAGGITGYSTGNLVQHAHAVSAVASPVGYAGVHGVGLGGLGYGSGLAYGAHGLASPVGYASGLGYGSGLAYGGIAHAPAVAYAQPAVVQKTIAPVAQSTAFVNRAPAARIAVAAAPVAVGVAHAAPALAYGAGYGHGLGGVYGGSLGYGGVHGLGAYGYGAGAPLIG